MKFQFPIWTNECKAVINFKGQSTSVEFSIEYDYHGVPSKCIISKFEKTDEELTKCCIDYGSGRGNGYVKWSGSPIFIQGEWYPLTDDNRPYDYLCTVDNNWGDMGNVNIFVLTNSSFELEDIYMEAHCH